MTASVPFAIEAVSIQAARLATPGLDPKDELGIRHSIARVRRVMNEMQASDIAYTDNWRRLGDLVDAILNPAATAAETIQPAE